MTNGIAIALAWPETKCKCPNSWYDGLMELMGISRGHYYKVGHAAIILIDPMSSVCHYFDFGRYHAPFGYGRVRNFETDHELVINTKGQIDSSGQLLNFDDILSEISKSEVWHGVGILHASILKINFKKALCKAYDLQKREFIKYGPFLLTGSNCSRFVRSVLLSGTFSIIYKLKLLLPLTITPTPLTNVRSLRNQRKIDAQKDKIIITETFKKKF